MSSTRALAISIFMVLMSCCGAAAVDETTSALSGDWISVSPTRLPSCSALAWFDSEHGSYATGYLCRAPSEILLSVEAGRFSVDNGVIQFRPTASTCPGGSIHFATYQSDADRLVMGVTYERGEIPSEPITLGCIDIVAQVFTEGPIAPIEGLGDDQPATLALAAHGMKP